jgi:hypothetical protein
MRSKYPLRTRSDSYIIVFGFSKRTGRSSTSLSSCKSGIITPSYTHSGSTQQGVRRNRNGHNSSTIRTGTTRSGTSGFACIIKITILVPIEPYPRMLIWIGTHCNVNSIATAGDQRGSCNGAEISIWRSSTTRSVIKSCSGY